MSARATKMSGQKDRKSWGSRTNTPLRAMGSPVGSDDERLDVDTILVAELRGRSQQASESQVKSHLKGEADTVATKPENRLVYANARGFSFRETLDHLMRAVESQKLAFESQKLEFEKMRKESENQKLQLEKLNKESQSEIRELKKVSRVSESEISGLKSAAQVSKNRIETLEGESEEHKTVRDTQELEVLTLSGRVTDLTSTSQGYLDIRMRFLDNYNKKVKRDPAFQQTAAIEIGNLRAHGGDAYIDATLFRDQKRLEDPGTYKELYGVDHAMVLKLAESEDGLIKERIYQVLNIRATQVAQKRPFSKELESAFKHYLDTLGKKGVCKAHSTFWKMYRKEYPLAE